MILALIVISAAVAFIDIRDMVNTQNQKQMPLYLVLMVASLIFGIWYFSYDGKMSLSEYIFNVLHM